ncbi:MAG: 4Fe-4S dicluster domain-containing protein [Candidatus Ranarchaeia archaeon]
MQQFFLPTDKIHKFLERIMEKHEVIAPQKYEETIEYNALENPEDLDMNFVKTVNGIKRFLFPQTETLYSMNKEKDKISIIHNEEENSDRIIFGARSCDSYAVFQQEMVFDELTAPDFTKKKKGLIIINVNCIQPDFNCFCNSMGTGPFAKEGYDIELTPIEEGYLFESGSSKGNSIIQETRDILRIATIKEQRTKKDLLNETNSKFKRRFNIDTLKEIGDLVFDDPEWDELAKSCIECGGCVFVCPSCTCFDLIDKEYIDSESIEHVRYWDACLLSSFTRMAGGENPRKTKGSRYRQRTYKKLHYTKLWYGSYHCVGCGRCIAICPGDIGIDKGISTMIKLRRKIQKESLQNPGGITK